MLSTFYISAVLLTAKEKSFLDPPPCVEENLLLFETESSLKNSRSISSNISEYFLFCCIDDILNLIKL